MRCAVYVYAEGAAHRAEDDDGLDIRVLKRAHVGVDRRDEHADVQEVGLHLAPLKGIRLDDTRAHETLHKKHKPLVGWAADLSGARNSTGAHDGGH